MKYLRKFETEADVMMMVQPNVVLVGDEARILYNVEPPKGAFIQHIDGELYTTDQWSAMGFANDEANGVAVISDNAKFVIAKTSLGQTAWSSDTSNAVEGVMLTSDSTTAKTDYAGAANTALISAIDTGKAAYKCANFTFPNGAKGYLPAFGEWVDAYAYKADVNAAMALIGGTALSGNIWSSTQYSAAEAWRLGWDGGYEGYSGKSSPYSSVRAFSAL